MITDYSCRPEFINFKRFIKGGHWLDLDWLWRITIDDIPIDTNTLFTQNIPFYVVTTNINTGKAHYIQATPDNVIELLKASCSVPLAYRNYPLIDNQPMTDGGVADSIPVEKAYQMGAKEITVILSRPLGYVKKPAKFLGSLVNFYQHSHNWQRLHFNAPTFITALLALLIILLQTASFMSLHHRKTFLLGA